MNASACLRTALLCGTALVMPGLLPAARAQAPDARPQGGQVVAGSAVIAGDAARTRITQSTDRAAIDWRSFDVGRDHTVQFQQPSTGSLTLNRVTGPDPSQIAGRIQANGQVAIVNQSGVVFHQGAQVDAAGLVVSTANIGNDAFMRGGRLTFDQPGRPDARIENRGTITVREAGLAALVAPQVANRGVIAARMGRVALAGAETSVVDLYGDGLMSLEVTSPVRQRPANGEALVTNTGTITATGGTVVLTAQAVDGLVQDLVRAGGRIEANTDPATGRAGRIVASGTGGAVRIEGEMIATGTAPGTRGGTIEAVADRVLVARGATVDASGQAGGGRIGIGTTVADNPNPRLARRAGIAQGATVRADATAAGDGGQIVLNAWDYTVHAGLLSATGGPEGGNGGFIEISSRRGLDIVGEVRVNAGAGGRAGTFLIDPSNLTVIDGPAGSGSADVLAADGVLGENEGPTTATVTNGQIAAAALNGNVVLEASENLTVDAAINMPANDLTLRALSSSSGLLEVTTNGSITLGTGNLNLEAQTFSFDGPVNVAAGTVTFTAFQSSGGFITQTAGGVITAGRITMSNPDGFSEVQLGAADNRIAEVGNLRANFGEIRLRNVVDLAVNGTMDGFSGVAVDVDGGSLLLAGSILSDSSIQLRTTGSIDTAVGSVIRGAGVDLLSSQLPGLTGLDTASTAGIVLRGTVQSPPAGESSPFSPLTMQAGLGGISQLAGFFEAGELSFTTPGSVNLPGGDTPNLLGTLANVNAGGDVTLSTESFGDLFLGQIVVGGTFTLNPLTGQARQNAGTTITANVLAGDAPFGGFLLTNTGNLINEVADLSGDLISLRNEQSLRVTGQVVVGGSSRAQFDVVGDFTLTGTGSISGGGGAEIRAAGSILTAAGSFIESGGGGAVILNAANVFDTAFTDPDLPGGITLGGRIGRVGGGDTIVLTAGTDGIVQTAGQIIGSTLTAESSGAVLLNGATTPNAIATLLGSSAGTDFVLDNGITNLAINGLVTGGTVSVRTGGAVTLLASSGVTGTDRVSFRVGDLRSPAGGTVTAPLVELAPFTANTFVDVTATPAGGGFNPTPTTLANITAGTIRLGASTLNGVLETTAGSMQFNSPTVINGTLDLRSLGLVTQAPGGSLTAAGLTGNVAASVALTEPTNNIPVLGDFIAGAGVPFTAPFELVTSGGLDIVGTVQAPAVTLTALGGSITESTGRILTTTLSVNAEADASLTGANQVVVLATSTVDGGLVLNNTAPVLFVGTGAEVVGNSGVVIRQDGDLSILGLVSGLNVFLNASGSINLDTLGAIQAPGSGFVNLAAGVDPATGLPLPGSVAGIGLLGRLGDAGGGNFVALLSGTGGIIQTGGQVIAGNLSVDTTGDALLNGATTPNRIATFESATVGGDLVLDTGPNAVSLGIGSDDSGGGRNLSARSVLFITSGTVTVRENTAVTGTERVSVRSGGLTFEPLIFSDTVGSLNAPLVEIAPFTAGQALEVSATPAAGNFGLTPFTAANINAGTLRLGGTTLGGVTTTTAGDIIFRGASAVAGGLDLRASGNVTQGAGSSVGAALLTGQVGGDLLLQEAGNNLPVIGAFTVDDFSLRTVGALSLTGNIDATTVALQAGGNITQAAGTRISAGSLDAVAPPFGNIVLTGDNLVGNIVRLQAGTVSYRNAGTLQVGGAINTASLDLDVTGDLVIPGTISVGGGSLTATGFVRLLSGGTLEGGNSSFSTLSVTGDQGITLGGTLDFGPGETLLTAGAAGIVQSGGRVRLNTLLLDSDGAVLLNGAGAATPNAIFVLGNANVAGALVLNNGVTPLQLSGTILAPTIDVTTAGAISVSTGTLVSATDRIGLRAGSLRFLTTPAGTPGRIAAPLVEIAPFTVGQTIDVSAAPAAGTFGFTPFTAANIDAATLRLGAVTELAGLNTTAGDIVFRGASGVAGTLDLRALGTISQEAGANLSVGALTGAAGGAVVLANPGNAIPVLGDFVSGGGFTLGTGGDLTIIGTLQAPGVDLSAGGSLLESGAGRIVASALSFDAGLNALLGGANLVPELGNATAGGDILFVTGSPTLTVPTGAQVLAGGNLAVQALGGDLAILGSLSGAGLQALAAGTINLAATGAALANGNGGLALLAAVDPATLNTDPTRPGALALAGLVRHSGSIPTIQLGAGTGGIVQTGGRIVGGNLFVLSGSDALLGSSTNSLAGLNEATVAGNLLLDNGTSDIVLADQFHGGITARSLTLRTAGDVALGAGGTVSLDEYATIRAGSFSVQGPTPFLPELGRIFAPLVEIAPFSAAGIVVAGAAAPGDFRMDPRLGSLITADLLRLGATTIGGGGTTATGILFNGPFAFANTLELRSLGDIIQSATVPVSAGVLTGSAGGSVALTGALNSLPVLSDFTAGSGFALSTATSLDIVGTLRAPNVALAAGEDILEVGAGRILGGTLSVSTPGAATLLGANVLTGLGASSTGGSLLLANTSTGLVVPLGSLVNAGGLLRINQSGNLVVDGTVSGNATTLAATGALQVNGNSAIARGGDLTLGGRSFELNGLLSAAGTVRINAGNVATLAGRVVGQGLVVNAPRITFGNLDAAATAVLLELGTAGTATGGNLAAGSLVVAGGATVDLTGSIAGTNGAAAAAIGRRATAGGTVLSEPLPNQDAFLFNACPIGVAACGPVVPPETPRTPEVRVPVTVADNPSEVIGVLDPTLDAAPLDRLRPPTPDVTVRLSRDQSEEEDLSPPNIRGEDF
ncbi:filamentous hemagglutinin N-terminal domain-containing protein [Muricoccus radiodurans]|uniref:two-partner secretion domain-containing protein n=1 Tax=Muricoccus radiodurans TaxID=2231721 RepID=UPI003CF0D191